MLVDFLQETVFLVKFSLRCIFFQFKLFGKIILLLLSRIDMHLIHSQFISYQSPGGLFSLSWLSCTTFMFPAQKKSLIPKIIPMWKFYLRWLLNEFSSVSAVWLFNSFYYAARFARILLISASSDRVTVTKQPIFSKNIN